MTQLRPQLCVKCLERNRFRPATRLIGDEPWCEHCFSGAGEGVELEGGENERKAAYDRGWAGRNQERRRTYQHEYQHRLYKQNRVQKLACYKERRKRECEQMWLKYFAHWGVPKNGTFYVGIDNGDGTVRWKRFVFLPSTPKSSLGSPGVRRTHYPAHCRFDEFFELQLTTTLIRS